MKRRHRRYRELREKRERLQRQLDLAANLARPRRVRTRAARYAAALAEQLGMITRPNSCSWCHRRRWLQRHHWNYDEPLTVTFLCQDCHSLADEMVWECADAG